MKIRSSFVTNSSSSSFVISHTKDKNKTMLDFISEHYDEIKKHSSYGMIEDMSKKEILEQIEKEGFDGEVKGEIFTFSDEGTSNIEYFLRYFCQEMSSKGLKDRKRWEVDYYSDDYGGWY